MKTKKPGGKYHIVMMWAGYVESCTTSCLIYVSGERFKTPVDAVKVLAIDMYHKYLVDVNPRRHVSEKACCVKSLNDVNNVFCPKCGRELEREVEFDHEGFCSFVVNLFSTTAVAYGESDGTCERDFVFSAWDADAIVGAKENEVVLLRECAEETLAEALYDQMPELMSKDVKEQLLNKLSSDIHQTDWQVMKGQAK